MDRITTTFKKSAVAGFTMMELLIAIAIIGIIAAIAVPSYMDYTRKAYYSEIVNFAAPFKLAVTECYHSQGGSLTDCSTGQHGVSSITGPIANSGIRAVSVSNGTIIITPMTQNGITSADTYILTPTEDKTTGVITWKSSGGGVTKGYAK